MTATDSFHDFVDQLADALEDGAAANSTGEDWAARLHFSRFHFDRMISSVAGEPPGAFRRRILLERAAYRMITTRAPLAGSRSGRCSPGSSGRWGCGTPS